MRKGNIIAALVCIFLAAFIIITAMGYPAGRDGVPGPGTFPIILSGILIIASLALLFESFKIDKTIKLNLINKDTKPVFITMGILVVYTAVLGMIGFCVTSALLLTGLIKWFSKRNIFISFGISALVTGLIFVVFSNVLRVPLSFGILF